MKKKNSVVGTVVVMIAVAALIVFGFLKVKKKEAEKGSEITYTSTKAEALLKKDLDTEYPSSAREVLRLYSRVLVCLYGGDGDVSDEQAEDLIDMIRLMYSKELLEENPREDHIREAMDEVYMYRDDGMSIYDYRVEKPNSAIKWSDETGKYYRLIAAYQGKGKGYMFTIHEQFILKNEDGRWKIHAWTVVDGEEMDLY